MIKPGQSWNDTKKEESAQGSFEPANTLAALGLKPKTEVMPNELGPQPADSASAPVESIKDKVKAIQKKLLGAAKDKAQDLDEMSPLAMSEKSMKKDEKKAMAAANSSKAEQGGVVTKKSEEMCKSCGEMHKTEKCMKGKSLRDMKKAEHQPHPGPSKSKHQSSYDAKKQAESEAHLKTPKGDAERKEKNASLMSQMNKGTIADFRQKAAEGQGVAVGENGKVPAVKQDHVTGEKTPIVPKDAPQATASVPPVKAAPKREFVQGKRFGKSMRDMKKADGYETKDTKPSMKIQKTAKDEKPVMKGTSLNDVRKADQERSETMVKALPKTAAKAKEVLGKIKK